MNIHTSDVYYLSSAFTAEHGSNEVLVKRLLPMLQEAKVSAYMNGHE
jgi:hypothetical protein